MQKVIAGQRFGRLTVIAPDQSSPSRHIRLLCQCDCGNQKAIRLSCLIAGTTVACGCLARERTSERRLVDMTGVRFGRLTAQKRVGSIQPSGAAVWECLCDCGATTKVSASSLVRGKGRTGTESCGCLARESASRCGVASMKRAGDRWLYEKAGKRLLMRSSWEVVFANWLDANDEPWEYEPQVFALSGSMRYVPDFYLPLRSLWVEVKGFLSYRAAEKIRRFRQSNLLAMVGWSFIAKCAGVRKKSDVGRLVQRVRLSPGTPARGQLLLF